VPSAQNRSVAQRQAAVSSAVAAVLAIPVVDSAVSEPTTTLLPLQLSARTTRTLEEACLVERSHLPDLAHQQLAAVVCSEEAAPAVDLAQPIRTPTLAVLAARLAAPSVVEAPPLHQTPAPPTHRFSHSLKRTVLEMRNLNTKPSHSNSPTRTTLWRSCA
jgi:hypothetical protein